jgi:hypothetical protein
MTNIYNGLLLGHKKDEVLIRATTWMNMVLSKRSQSQRPRVLGFQLYKMCRIGKPTETQSRLVIVGMTRRK